MFNYMVKPLFLRLVLVLLLFTHLDNLIITKTSNVIGVVILSGYWFVLNAFDKNLPGYIKAGVKGTLFKIIPVC